MNQIFTYSKTCLLGVYILLTALFNGCSTSPIVINPDYNSQKLKTDTLKSKIKIVKAVDNRPYISKYNAGTAQVGLVNTQVPFNFSVPVSTFVENAVSKIFNTNNNDSVFVPVTLIIDDFFVSELTTAFSETGNFDCRMRFIYPAAKDSMKEIRTSSKKSKGGLDVTSSLEGLVYDGISDCAHQFAEKYNSVNNLYFVSAGTLDELKSVDSTPALTAKTNTAAGDTIYKVKTDFASSLGFTYLSGDKIIDGFTLTYQTFNSKKKSTEFQHGLGYSFSYYNIVNSKVFLSGHFVSFNGRYALRYYLDEPRKGFFIGASLKLSFGNETIDYPYGGEISNFFFGPTLEESIGISIAETVFLEAGLFQIKHFGSDLLPDDVGFNFGISFSL